MNIVSLLPSATEILYALGLEDQVAGVSSDCDYPPQASAKPSVSSSSLEQGDSPSATDRAVREALSRGEPIYRLDTGLIQEIRPDLILAQDLCRVCAVPSGHVDQALDVIGCSAEVISLDPQTLDDVLEGIERVGAATGRVGEAARVVAELRNRIDRVRVVQSAEPIRSVALEWSDPPFVGGHWIPEMVAVAGGLDAIGTGGKPSRRIDWSDVADASPEVIVVMPCGYGLADAVQQARALYDVPAISGSPAGLQKRVFAVDGSSYFSRPGPRLIDGIEILAWVFHPDRAPKPPPGRVARVAS